MSRQIISDRAILAGTPVFRGTRIPLSQIVGLVRAGVSASVIEEDYPALSPENLRFVRLFTRLIPACVAVDEFAARSIQMSRKRSAQ